MKEVVILKSGNTCELITPKWTHEFLNRKGIENYIYGISFDYKGKTVFKLENPEELNDPKETYFIFYSRFCIGEYNKVAHKSEINIKDLLENREDKDLIEIAKQINNEELIKIVEIPDDVEYDVCSYDCGFGEYIAEKHRTWD